jgi:bifunctional DNA-binding transcriptional regulator/antitoxin component of YhaV-PrlF toxin-antitoxin module
MSRRSLDPLVLPSTRLAMVTSKRQLTLPIAIRRRWGLHPGDKVALRACYELGTLAAWKIKPASLTRPT